jgi:NitT/TauT family transport system ATP-binding protein
MQDLWMNRKSTVLLVTHDLREAAYLANRVCVMSARPGRIIDDRPLNFARPRAIDVTFEPPFIEMVQDLRQLIVHTPAAEREDAA